VSERTAAVGGLEDRFYNGVKDERETPDAKEYSRGIPDPVDLIKVRFAHTCLRFRAFKRMVLKKFSERSVAWLAVHAFAIACRVMCFRRRCTDHGTGKQARRDKAFWGSASIRGTSLILRCAASRTS
jgi:hypothetical protein